MVLLLILWLCAVAGIPPEMLVEAHGTFATATCTSCLRKYEGQDLRVSPCTRSMFPIRPRTRTLTL